MPDMSQKKMTTASVREAVERLRQNIADDEYQSWGQKSDIEEVCQAAAERDAMKEENAVLRERVAEFFTIWDSDTATEAQVDGAFSNLRAAAGIPAPQDPPQQVKNPSGWGHE